MKFDRLSEAIEDLDAELGSTSEVQAIIGRRKEPAFKKPRRATLALVTAMTVVAFILVANCSFAVWTIVRFNELGDKSTLERIQSELQDVRMAVERDRSVWHGRMNTMEMAVEQTLELVQEISANHSTLLHESMALLRERLLHDLEEENGPKISPP